MTRASAPPRRRRDRPAREFAAFGSAFFLAVRRTRRDILALLAILVLAAVTGGLAVGIPARIEATLDAAAREAVAAAGSDADLLVRSAVADASGQASTSAERLLAFAAELPDRLPPGLAEVADGVATGIIGPELDARAPTGEVRVRVGVLDPSAVPGVRVESGALPSNGSTGAGAEAASIVVAVSSATARAAGLSVGDTVHVSEALGGEDVTIGIEAIVDPVDPLGRAWVDLPGVWDPQTLTAHGEPSGVAFTALTDQGTFDRVAERFPEASEGTIRTSFDAASFDLERYERVRAAIDELETSSSSIGSDAPFTVVATSGYEAALEDFPAAVTGATAQFSTIAAGLLGVAVLVSVLSSAALARRRRAEIALLRARGASLGLIGAHAGAESVGVTLFGVALGVAAATVFGAAPTSWSLLIAVTAVLVAAPVVGTLRPLLPPLSPARSRTVGLASIAVLVSAAIAAVIALQSGVNREMGGTGVGAGQGGIDPLALAAPVLCAAVVACGVAPLAALVVRPLSRLTSQTRGAGPLLAGSSAREGRSLLTLIALILASSSAITSLVLLQTVAAGQEAMSWRIVGADVRITGTTDEPALLGAFRAAGSSAASVAPLDVEAEAKASPVSVTLLAVDAAYPDLIATLPTDDPQRASVETMARLTDPSVAEAAGGAVPIVIDARLAARMDAEEFTLDIAGVSVPVAVLGDPVAAPGYVEGPVATVDRSRLAAHLKSAGVDAETAESALRPTTVLAIGGEVDGVLASHPEASAAPDAHIVVRDEVLADRQGGALVSGITTALLQSLIATGGLAALALVVTTVLGARRRGGTLALLETLGARRRIGVSLAVGELTPLVLGGVVGGVIAAGVVVVAAGSAFGIDSLVGAIAVTAVPVWIPAAVLGAGVLALVLAVLIDTPLSRRVGATEILRTGEES